jgi:hypothetical protein
LAKRTEWAPSSGGDFTVNQDYEGTQRQPDIAMDAGGRFAIAWHENDKKDDKPIEKKNLKLKYKGRMDTYLAAFDSGGTRIGNDRRLGASSGHQVKPKIAMRGGIYGGNLVAVWQDDTDYNGWWQIKRQTVTYGVLGVEVGPSRTVNSIYDGQQFDPDVALTGDGQAMIVWADDLNENDYFEVLAASFDIGASDEPEADSPVDKEIENLNIGPPRGPTSLGRDSATLWDGLYEMMTEPTSGIEAAYFGNGFVEIISEEFDADSSAVVGTSILLDVFIEGTNPSGYDGAVQLYLTVPETDHTHRFLSQVELTPLAQDQWHTIELPITTDALELLLGEFEGAQFSLTVNTEVSGPQRVAIAYFRYGGELRIQDNYECSTPECLALCGAGKEDCDNDPDNGCETNTSSDPSSCGGCGLVCVSGLCAEGTCVEDSSDDGRAEVCNPDTAIDLGGTGNFVTVPTNACLMIDAGFPSWWGTSRTMKVQVNGGTEYPLRADWVDTCADGMGMHTFTGNWNDMVFGPTSNACPTFIKLGGDGGASVDVRYYGQ